MISLNARWKGMVIVRSVVSQACGSGLLVTIEQFELTMTHSYQFSILSSVLYPINYLEPLIDTSWWEKMLWIRFVIVSYSFTLVYFHIYWIITYLTWNSPLPFYFFFHTSSNHIGRFMRDTFPCHMMIIWKRCPCIVWTSIFLILLNRIFLSCLDNSYSKFDFF